MKQIKFIVLLGMIMFNLPSTSFAQKTDQLVSLKPGSWFEVQVTDTSSNPISENYQYLLKYLLRSIDSKGNKEYKLTFQRIRIVLSAPNQIPLGFDSFYPPFKQGIDQKSAVPAFSLTANKDGKILKIKPDSYYPPMDLQEIALRKSYGGSSVELPAVHKETAAAISSYILKAIANKEDDWYNGKNYNHTKLGFTMTKASFPLRPNILLEGNIKNMNEQIRNGLKIYLPGSKRELQISKDGSFSVEALIDEGIGASILFKKVAKRIYIVANKTSKIELDTMINSSMLNIPLFFQPGDTLHFYADANHFEESLQFSGKAARMATLGLKLARSEVRKKAIDIEYGAASFSAENFMLAQNIDKDSFTKILKKYINQIPTAVIKWYETKFIFEQANSRLDFLLKINFRNNPQAKEIFSNFPPNFFKAIDTLPVTMLNDNSAQWYSAFLNSFHTYMTFKNGQYNGGSHGFFLGDYVLSLNYLRRFPLYQTLANAFDKELRQSSWKTAQKLKPYYNDFMNNCGDTALTESVKERWNTLSKWAPGKLIPFKKIRLKNGELLDLEKYKGRALSITFNFHYPEEMRKFLARIKKQDPNKLHFIIIQLKVDGYPSSTISNELKKLPQVTYVEIDGEDKALDQAILINFFDIKTFIIDAQQRVVEDNINDSPNQLPQEKAFEEALEKAYLPKIMGKAQKDEILKTVLWSLGSIILVSLIFLWIYKARVSAIKKKESFKRQIKELEIKAIRSQMNPHFIFNALNSIQSLINGRNYKDAIVYLEKFSLLMRSVLNHSEKTFVSLSDELNALKLYVELEKLRFDFVVSIVVDVAVNIDLIEIPGMIIQPLIENAILHGIAQKGSKGTLEVLISKKDHCLEISIIDNGIGFEKKNEKKYKGFGLKLVQERLDLLNTEGGRAKLEIRNNLNTEISGTTAKLIIPIE